MHTNNCGKRPRVPLQFWVRAEVCGDSAGGRASGGSGRPLGEGRGASPPCAAPVGHAPVYQCARSAQPEPDTEGEPGQGPCSGVHEGQEAHHRGQEHATGHERAPAAEEGVRSVTPRNTADDHAHVHEGGERAGERGTEGEALRGAAEGVTARQSPSWRQADRTLAINSASQFMRAYCTILTQP